MSTFYFVALAILGIANLAVVLAGFQAVINRIDDMENRKS